MLFVSVGRILEPDECPLELQSRWNMGEHRTFTLTQAEFEVSKDNPCEQVGGLIVWFVKLPRIGMSPTGLNLNWFLCNCGVRQDYYSSKICQWN